MKAKSFIKKLAISLATSLPVLNILTSPIYAQSSSSGTVEEVTQPLSTTGDNVMFALCAGFALLVIGLMCILLYLLLSRRREEDEVYYRQYQDPNNPYPQQQVYQ